MKTFTASAATPPGYELAEGVIWDDAHGLVRWVNVWAGEILSAILEAGSLTSITATSVGQTAGAIALAANGGILVAGARGLITISREGIRTDGPDLLGDRDHGRFNDGAVDPHGRFIVGTLSLGDPTGSEQLLRISADGTVEVLRSEVQLSNGIAWSPDGHTIYHVDTRAATVSSHAYDAGGSTSRIIFSPTFIVHYLSRFLALEPGDLINTGTPPGVGLGLYPPVFLHGGETMTLGITHLGTQTHRVIAHPDAAR